MEGGRSRDKDAHKEQRCPYSFNMIYDWTKVTTMIHQRIALQQSVLDRGIEHQRDWAFIAYKSQVAPDARKQTRPDLTPKQAWRCRIAPQGTM